MSGNATKVCVPQLECGIIPPTADAGPPVSLDAGSSATGTIGLDGGTASRLLFAAVGDTRGDLPLDSAYPTATITQIYKTIEGFSPHPLFVVSTGDFAFELLTDTSTQLGYYLTARNQFTGPFFPVLGNHECFTTVSFQLRHGQRQRQHPAVHGVPEYHAGARRTDDPLLHVPRRRIGRVVDIEVRHHRRQRMDRRAGDVARQRAVGTDHVHLRTPARGRDSDHCARSTPSATIIANHPYTLLVVGHIHTYSHSGQQVLFGNGGAPLNAAVDYGFGLFNQQSDGTIQVDAIDYKTGLADSTFRFRVHPDGTPAP